MNRRKKKKLKREILLKLLEASVKELDGEGHYTARVVHNPSVELKTIFSINGYRIEIRTSRETNHKYAHFHVVKGKNEGMASIRIDDLTVLKSSLPKKDLRRILEWAQEKRDLLVRVWNEFHGSRIIVE